MSGFWALVLSAAFVVGVVGNLVASAIWASPAGVALARKLNRHHAEHLATAERHHLEATAQRTAHHNEARQQAERHHAEALDQAEAHQLALKVHVSSATSGFVADLAKAVRVQGGDPKRERP